MNMKLARLFLMAALLVGSTTANAIPVSPGHWATLTLADGTTVRAELYGNEFFTWYQDEQGQCYVQQGDTYVKAEAAEVNAQLKRNTTERRGAMRRALSTSTKSGLGAYGKNSGGAMYSVGEWEIPVLMVEFSDVKFDANHTESLIQDYLTKEGFTYTNPTSQKTMGIGSVRDYFVAQSQGMFKPNFKLLGKVTVDKPMAYYGKNDEKQKDVNAWMLPGDAMRAAAKQLQGIDFTKYIVKKKDELHEDGIPLICILHAGEAESNVPENTDLLWPHELDLYYDKKEDIHYELVKIDGYDNDITLNSYFIGNEREVITDKETEKTYNSLQGIGVFVHELGHALGLPDWYCTATDEKKVYKGDDGFGQWSVMDVGCLIFDVWNPIGYTAYERSYMGWLDIPAITKGGHIKLDKPYDKDYCGVFYSNGSTDDKEYFVIESRAPIQSNVWYPKAQILRSADTEMSFGSGLMLSRFAFNEKDWTYDVPNNEKDAKCGMIITADGAKINRTAFQTNLYGNGVSTISGKKYLSGKAWDASFTNIKKNEDGSVEFDLSLGGGESGIIGVKGDAGSQQDTYYDLQGRPVSEPGHGVYIYKGKKVVK